MTPSTSRRRSKWWAVAWCSWTTKTPALTPRIANCSWPSTRTRSLGTASPTNAMNACNAWGAPSAWISPVGRTQPTTPNPRASAATAAASIAPAAARSARLRAGGGTDPRVAAGVPAPLTRAGSAPGPEAPEVDPGEVGLPHEPARAAARDPLGILRLVGRGQEDGQVGTRTGQSAADREA